MPLTNLVCEEIIAFRSELRARAESREATSEAAAAALDAWIAKHPDCGKANATIIRQLYLAQHRVSVWQRDAEGIRRRRRGRLRCGGRDRRVLCMDRGHGR